MFFIFFFQYFVTCSKSSLSAKIIIIAATMMCDFDSLILLYCTEQERWIVRVRGVYNESPESELDSNNFLVVCASG